jgi:hypothetical protein
VTAQAATYWRAIAAAYSALDEASVQIIKAVETRRAEPTEGLVSGIGGVYLMDREALEYIRRAREQLPELPKMEALEGDWCSERGQVESMS